MRSLPLALVSVLCGALLVPSASARPAAGLTVNNTLVTFDTATPGTLTSGPNAIVGLGAGDTLVDIDLRPANGGLYALGKDPGGDGRVYLINRSTLSATLVASLYADPADLTSPYTSLTGNEFGIDFDPVRDRLRVTSDSGQNLRINVVNGLVTTDADLNPGAPLVTANAYTKPVLNTTTNTSSSTVYGLEFASNSLVILNPPNNGTLVTVGTLSSTAANTISGFDIPSDIDTTEGFASLTASSAPTGSVLGSVNLSTGAFTTIGSSFIGGGSPVRGLALLPNPEAPSLVVTTTSDVADNFDGKTSLREAINFANTNGDTSAITFDLPAGTRTVSLLTALPALATSMTIDGSLAGVRVERSSGANTPNFRIFDISAGASVGLSNLTIAGGRVVAQGSPATGGGIRSFGNMLILGNCTVRDNSAVGNIGHSEGGGIHNGNGSFIAVNSTISGNTANCSNPEAGAALGGGIRHSGGTMQLINCTVAANTLIATNGGAAYGGGLYANGGLTLKNTIIASNSNGGDDFPNLAGGFTNSGGNIIDGDPKLGPLADNGGATPTHALFSGSPAINVGVSDGAPPTDQRGTTRQGQPDSGAYEFINFSPTVTAVTPQNETDAVGEQQTFSLKVSDGNGVGDISEVWLLINTRLDWAEGATLVYQPATGDLYLRRGDTFLGPIKIGSAAGASDILDNGALRIVGSQVSVETSGDGNGLTLSIPATVRNGLVGNNTLYGRVQDMAGQVDPAAVNATGFVGFGPYTVTPQFQSDVNRVPTLSALSPKAANTLIPTMGTKLQTFVFYATDEDGIGDLDSLWFMAGKQRDWTGSATFVFLPRTRRLYLRSDDGQSFLGGGVIGTQGSIENSQVKVDLSTVQYLIYADGKNVGLRLPLQPKAGLIGQNQIWLRVQDNSGATSTGGDNLGFVQSGTWNVTKQSGTVTGAGAPSAPGS